jgi:hypothetical protein
MNKLGYDAMVSHFHQPWWNCELGIVHFITLYLSQYLSHTHKYIHTHTERQRAWSDIIIHLIMSWDR